MDELEKKAQKGLESFSKKGDINTVKSELNGLIDDMLGEDEEFSISKGKNKSKKWIYILLATLGMILILYMGYKDGSKEKGKVEPPVLYAQYFEVLPDAISSNERGEDDGSEDSDNAMNFYNDGNYQNAAILLEKKGGLDHLVYAAIAEMKNEKLDSAIDLFLKSRSIDTEDKYKDIIDWYLSLAYLKSGNIDKAKTNLQPIATGKHYKNREAKSILKSLK